jgi:uncharacterized protein with FMN-binding domain
MKRALLIASGTISGLGAVLAITPPQLSTLATGVATQPAPQPSSSSAPTKAPSAAAGTFSGDAVNVSYGIVQVKITVANGKITDAQAVQAPTGRNDRWTQNSVPILRKNTLAAQSANINGASCCSYTSYGWKTSLASALTKAGMP